jgi:hypothetical protein
MGLVSLGGGTIQWPPCVWASTQNTAPALSTFTAMTGANFSTSYIFTIPKSGTIAYIGLRPGTSTSGHVTVALQTVNSSGQPSGTNYGSSAASASTALTTGTPLEIALTTPATAVEGDLVALVVTYASGTTVQVGSDSRLIANFPFTWTYNGSAYTAVNPAMLCTLGYSTITATGASGYVPIDQGSPAIESFTTTAYNSGTTTNHRALKITAPCDMTVEGCWVWGLWASGASLVVNLYSGTSSTPVASTNAIADVDGFATTGVRFLKFTAPYNMTNGGTYYLSLEPQNTNNFTDYEMTFSAFSYQYSNPINNLPGGIDAVLATAPTASGGVFTWTPTPTRRPLCGLLVSQFAQSASSGGILYPPGLSGGLG